MLNTDYLGVLYHIHITGSNLRIFHIVEPDISLGPSKQVCLGTFNGSRNQKKTLGTKKRAKNDVSSLMIVGSPQSVENVVIHWLSTFHVAPLAQLPIISVLVIESINLLVVLPAHAGVIIL